MGKTKHSKIFLFLTAEATLINKVNRAALPRGLVFPKFSAKKGTKRLLFAYKIIKIHASHATSLIELLEQPKATTSPSIMLKYFSMSLLKIGISFTTQFNV